MNWLERSWYKQAYWSYLLAPLSLLFALISGLRRALFKLGLSKQNEFSVPVIVVGNISVGGTGKTPFTVYLVELLKQQGFKPGIVSRGYGAEPLESEPFPRVVKPDTDVALSGDEPKLLAMRTGVPVVIAPKRSDAVNLLSKDFDCDVVISDDGLQHYAMARDIEIVLLDKQRGVGNGWLLPVGPLREGVGRLNTVDLVIENAGFSNEPSLDYRLTPSLPYQIADREKQLNTQGDIHLVSGIGNPQRFLDTATGMGLSVASTTWFPDHHKFTLADFAHFNAEDIVVMTEKDAVKCINLRPDIDTSYWYVLPIQACISSSTEQQIIKTLEQIK